jgi:hypothetical protein
LETQVNETTQMLQRLYKSHYVGEGKVSYRRFIELMDVSLSLEDYREYGKSLMGFKTVCAQYERRLSAIWEEVYKQNNQ